MNKSTDTAKHHSRLLLPLTLIVIVSLAACNLSSLRQATPTSTEAATATTTPANTATAVVTPTATARPKVNLSPALVEANPNPGSELALNSPVVLVFNQAMDEGSVEAAVQASPKVSGKYTWSDSKTLTFTPDQPLQASSKLTLTVATSAKAANGLALKAAVSVQYTTAGPLALTQGLPLDGNSDIAPSSAVVASFNRPVVALGSSDASNPVGFTLSPTAAGTGKWINTSTYIFYPDPALSGGTKYTVQINPDLKSTQGSALDAQSTQSWSFTTAMPQVTKVTPAMPGLLALDGSVVVTFNISMDPTSVAANFSMKDSGGNAVKGDLSWNDSHTTLTFKPSATLPRDTTYNIQINMAAQAFGGTTLGIDYHTQVQTYPALSVLSTTPAQGATLTGYGNGYASVSLAMSAPLKDTDLSSYVSFDGKSSDISAYFDTSSNQLAVAGYLEPSSQYTMTLSADLPDPWGGTLGTPFTYTFKTPEATPTINLTSQQSSNFVFLTTDDTGIQASVTNIDSVTLKRADMKLSDLFALNSPSASNTLDKYVPTNPISWTQSLSAGANYNQTVSLQVDPGKKTLAPGIYYYSTYSKLIEDQEPRVAVLVVSSIQIVLKVSAQQVFVWAVTLSDHLPVAGKTVTIYDENGNTITTGTTDANGIFQKDVPQATDVFGDDYAVMGTPGQSDFALGATFWSQGLSGYDYGLSTDYSGSTTKTYIYTDRSIYQPGQTVNFKALVSNAYNGRYTSSGIKAMAVKILGDSGNMGTPPLLYSQTLTLSSYGTLNGSYTLPDTASTGTYQIEIMNGTDDSTATYLQFTVANYVKPEIELTLTLSPGEIQSGQDLAAKLIAQYYFGAPAGNVSVSWTVYRQSTSFNIPQYQTGLIDTSWVEPYWMRYGDNSLGTQVAKGQDQTAADGTLNISLQSSTLLLNDTGGTEQFTLEVTAQEEGGQPVSTRATALMHPSDDYIGVHPDNWTSQAGQAIGFSIQTVDWKVQPVGNKALSATFSSIKWVQKASLSSYSLGQYTSVTKQIASANPTTDASGQARLSFTPTDPGNYLLDITDGKAHTQVLIWVGGAGSATWTNLSNNQLHLTADADSYKAGQTANVFIPNPLGDNATALITLERGKVITSQVVNLTSAGTSFPVTLSDDDAPNVILSVTLIGQEQDTQQPGYRQGYLNLSVAPTTETLNVQVTADPTSATAGQSVTLNVKVTDSAGKPVQGEFSVGVEDLAVLALASDNASDILSEYYGTQPLGVRTSLSLNGWGGSVYASPAGGRGGGGGSAQASGEVRQNFQDTAYWAAAVVTGADGSAKVTFNLPDNLTTWQVKVRGLTSDEKVGEGTTQITTSKPLLVRPQTPSFMVAGDHTQLSAIVNNNTSTSLQVAVSLQATGFTLDDANTTTQTVAVASLGHTSVTWWGTAQDVDSIDLLFNASSGDLKDAVRPDSGKLPVKHYASPQTFSTSGELTTADSVEELVSVPSSYTPTGGTLSLTLSSSLAQTMIAGMSALDYTDPKDTADVLATFLPNLEAAQTLKQLGNNDADLQNSLTQKAQQGLNALLNLQNSDGGWGWWGSSSDSLQNSDAYITAAALFGLNQANAAGYSVSTYSVQIAQQYLAGFVHQPKAGEDVTSLDSDVFETYAMVASGETTISPTIIKSLSAARTSLSPWAQALLALSKNTLNPGDASIKTILSDLESGAIQSATGVNWETKESGWVNPGSPVFTTAVVLYTIAQLDPKSALTQPAIRYLMANRSGSAAWSSGYETAWVLMALGETLKGTNELQASYDYTAGLNGGALASGQAGGSSGLTSSDFVLPLSALDATYPNQVDISRGDGTGTLYYRLDLQVDQPVESATPVSMGLSLTRSYILAGQDCKTQTCQPISQVAVSTGSSLQAVKVQLTLTLEHDMYNLIVDDYIPAGASIFNSSLLTSQQGLADENNQLPYYSDSDPYAQGFGWWYFSSPQIYTDHVEWSAAYLQAGTYQLTYTIIPNQAGEFRVIPAHAWEEFFPEVQGTSAGAIFKITQ